MKHRPCEMFAVPCHYQTIVRLCPQAKLMSFLVLVTAGCVAIAGEEDFMSLTTHKDVYLYMFVS